MSEPAGCPVSYECDPPPPGYPPGHTGPPRPAVVSAAAVLGFVQAGIAIACVLLVALLSWPVTAGGPPSSDEAISQLLPHAALLINIGVLQLLCCGLLIAGAVLLLRGRTRIVLGCAMVLQCLLCVVYGIVGMLQTKFATTSDAELLGWLAMMASLFFVIMPVIGLAHITSRSAT